MAQPQALTVEQIQSYQNQIRNAGSLAQQKAAALLVYQELYDKGCNYAGWALGVAKGNTITGTAALDYLSSTALMGVDGDACRNLSATQIDRIRVDMAFNTMEQMSLAAEDSGGVLTQDLDFKPVEAAHKKTFEDNGLSLSNWTLNTPMTLYRQAYGEAAAEALWMQIRETGGDGFDGVMASTGLKRRGWPRRFNLSSWNSVCARRPQQCSRRCRSTPISGRPRRWSPVYPQATTAPCEAAKRCQAVPTTATGD